jgi:uncharacterized protein (UPF0332 family)
MKKHYRRLLREGRIQSHRTNPAEIASLFAVVERDLADAAIAALSADRRFVTAYNAVLQTATAMMYAEGYRTAGSGHHRTSFEFLKAISESEFGDWAGYFDDCRRKRNQADYVGVGYISDTEAEYLWEEARKFADIARTWIQQQHSALMPV